MTVAPNVGAVGRSIGLPVLGDDHRVTLHERLRIGDARHRSNLVDDSTGSRRGVSKPRKLSTELATARTRRPFVDVGEQRVERALARCRGR